MALLHLNSVKRNGANPKANTISPQILYLECRSKIVGRGGSRKDDCPLHHLDIGAYKILQLVQDQYQVPFVLYSMYCTICYYVEKEQYVQCVQHVHYVQYVQHVQGVQHVQALGCTASTICTACTYVRLYVVLGTLYLVPFTWYRIPQTCST